MAGVVVRCAPRVQGKFHRARQVARRVAGERLPTWACMEAVAAEALSGLGGGGPGEEADASGGAGEAGFVEAVGLGAGGAGEEGARGGGAGSEGGACWRDRGAEEGTGDAQRDAQPGEAADVCAPQPPAAVQALVDGLEAADAFDLDARLRRAVALEQRLEAAMAPLLLRMADARLHRRSGHASLAAFARERLGMSERKARALVRIARATAGCPELGAAFGTGALSWIQAQALLPLLLAPECAPFRAAWVARAQRVTVRRLDEDVDAAQLRLVGDPDGFLAGAGAPGAPEAANRQTCAQPRGMDTPSPPEPAADPEPETARFFFAAPRDVARLFRAVACSVRRALERRVERPGSEGEAGEWMFDHAFETWGANDLRVRREHRVFERDGWRCTVPGCSSYRNLHDHHVVFRSAGGSDDPANRTTLCAFHHLRGVHAGRVRCLGEAPAGLVFELGLRPGRPPLLRYGAGEEIGGTSSMAAHARSQRPHQRGGGERSSTASIAASN
jgi:hypothetical protein